MTEQDGEVSLIVNCPADCTPGNLLVRGTDIPIAVATLRVRDFVISAKYTSCTKTKHGTGRVRRVRVPMGAVVQVRGVLVMVASVEAWC